MGQFLLAYFFLFAKKQRFFKIRHRCKKSPKVPTSVSLTAQLVAISALHNFQTHVRAIALIIYGPQRSELSPLGIVDFRLNYRSIANINALLSRIFGVEFFVFPNTKKPRKKCRQEQFIMPFVDFS